MATVSAQAMLKSLLSPIDEVEPGLYIGNKEAGRNKEIIEGNGIEVVLQLGTKSQRDLLEPDLADAIEHFFVILGDNPINDLLAVVPTCHGIIDTARGANKRILVHCDAGSSRSGAIIVSYIMKKYRMSFEEAVVLAKTKRPCILPNEGFEKQLKNYYRDVISKAELL